MSCRAELSYVALPLMAALLAGCSSSDDGGASGGGSTGLCPATSNGDTLYCRQWHLKNTGQVTGGVAGEDINVESVWATYRGQGQRIAIVDDGLEIAHEDLSANVVAGGSHNYLNGSNDPTGGDHGTSVAGVAAAVGFNDLGVRGVAPAAELVGFNLTLSATSVNEGDAMAHDPLVAVSNNSWGPPDGTGLWSPSNGVWRAGALSAVTNARGGKGTAIFWAGGNGGRTVDNANYDGYANYNAVMAIGALGVDGRKASYSEEGANLLLTAPSGEFCDGSTSPPTTVTTDRSGVLGSNAGSSSGELADANYTQCFNGTSSATPVVAGAAALVFQARPALTWRDLRAVLAKSARKNHATDSDWQLNGAGLNINHKYGFGALDVQAAVTQALSWSLLPVEQNPETFNATVNTAIADPVSSGLFGAATSNDIAVTTSAISQIEFVDVTFTSNHSDAGNLEVVLTSPSGTQSVLAERHRCSGACGTGYSAGWRFGSLRHMDESPIGNWRLSVRDGFTGNTGDFQSWQLVLRGH